MSSVEKLVRAQMAAWRVGRQRRPLLSEATTLIVAVSGGPDSLALLHLLSQRRLHRPDKLIVAHLNHQLRPGAGADAAFVRATAAEWGLAYREATVDVSALAVAEGLSLEEAGRVARYRFLADLCRRLRCHFVATGHQADDQAETVLHNLLRGTGPAGLSAMAVVAPLPHSGAWPAFVVRPLLDCSAAAVRDYCRVQGLKPRLDPSNRSNLFRRNKIRNELLPTLQGYNPQIRSRLRTLARLAAEDEALFTELVTKVRPEAIQAEGVGWLRLRVSRCEQLPLAIRRRLYRLAVAAVNKAPVEISFRSLDKADQIMLTEKQGAQATLPGGVILLREKETLLFYRPEVNPAEFWPQLPATASLSLPVPGEVSLAGHWRLTAQLLANPGPAAIRAEKDSFKAYVKRPESAHFMVRRRDDVGRFMLSNGHSQDIHKYLSQRGIPGPGREHWPLVAAETVVWVPGAEVDRRHFLDDSASQAVLLICRRRDVS